MSEREKYPSEAAERFQVRLPEGLRDRIRRVAEMNGRSMNAEIVARLGGFVSPDAEGWVRIWLPSDLIERVEAAAAVGMTTPEILMRDAIEEAFPYIPTLRDYVRGLREELDKAGDNADTGLFYFVRQAEEMIETYPELGDRTLDVPDRGFEMGP